MRRIERSIIKLPKLLRECQRTIRAVRELPVSARGKRSTIIHRISLALQEEVDWLEEFLTGMRFMALDQPDRDYGWETIPTLITNSKTKLWRALFRIEAVEASDPGSTPYMLIWGMYTGAVYDLMNAEILLDRKLDLIRDLISLYSILISKKRANAKSSVQRTLRFQ